MVRQNRLKINCQNKYLEDPHTEKPRNCDDKVNQRIHVPSLVNCLKHCSSISVHLVSFHLNQKFHSTPGLQWLLMTEVCKGLEDSKTREQL